MHFFLVSKLILFEKCLDILKGQKGKIIKKIKKIIFANMLQ